MNTKTPWTATDLTSAKSVCVDRGGQPNEIRAIEFRDATGEWRYFYLLKTEKRIVFGGYCNTGFLECGFIAREDGESLDETLSELVADLETYYNDGAQYVSRIVTNDRM